MGNMAHNKRGQIDWRATLAEMKNEIEQDARREGWRASELATTLSDLEHEHIPYLKYVHRASKRILSGHNGQVLAFADWRKRYGQIARARASGRRWAKRNAAGRGN